MHFKKQKKLFLSLALSLGIGGGFDADYSSGRR